MSIDLDTLRLLVGEQIAAIPLGLDADMTESAPTDTGQLGEAAKRLLEDPVLALAMERVQEKLLDSWRHTAPGEVDAREKAYALYWAAEQFRSELRIMLGNARALEARERLLNER